MGLLNFLFGNKQHVLKKEIYNGFDDPGIGVMDRRASSDGINRTMDISDQEKQANRAFNLYQKNALAYAIVNTITHFCIQKGIIYHTENENVKKAIKEFWECPDNQLNKKTVQSQMLRDALLGGELMYPIFVGDNAGLMRLGYYDTNSISEIYRDEKNQKKLKSVMTNYGNSYDENDAYTIVNNDWDTTEKKRCFLFQINRFTSSTRGWGVLTPVLDYLDIFDLLVFGMDERLELQSRYCVDVTLNGADQSDIDKYIKENTFIKPGAMKVHNENTIIKMVAPNLPSSDYEKSINITKQTILSALGLPEHWFGNVGSGNRSTASDTAKSATMNIEYFQSFFMDVLKELTRYQLYQYVQKDMHSLTIENIDEFSLIAPQLFIDDYSTIIGGLLSLSISLQNAEGNGYIDQSEAAYVYRYAITQLGIDLQDAPKMEFDTKPQSKLKDDKDILDELKDDATSNTEQYLSGSIAQHIKYVKGTDSRSKEILDKVGL